MGKSSIPNWLALVALVFALLCALPAQAESSETTAMIKAAMTYFRQGEWEPSPQLQLMSAPIEVGALPANLGPKTFSEADFRTPDELTQYINFLNQGTLGKPWSPELVKMVNGESEAKGYQLYLAPPVQLEKGEDKLWFAPFQKFVSFQSTKEPSIQRAGVLSFYFRDGKLVDPKVECYLSGSSIRI